MPKISFNCQPMVTVAANDQQADVRSAFMDTLRPLVVRRPAFADPLIQIDALPDVQDIVEVSLGLAQDGINAGVSVEPRAQVVNLELVSSAADALEDGGVGDGLGVARKGVPE